MRRTLVLTGLFLLLMMATACSGEAESATTDVSADATVVGDPERGRDIWETGGGVIESTGCAWCHSLDGSELTGDMFRLAPSWLGISQRAGNRVPGMSSEEYLRESMVDPSAFIVEGYPDRMHSYRYELTDADVNSLTAFLLTL